MPQKILLGSQHSSGRGMRVVQMEDLGGGGGNIQKEYIKHYAFSTNHEKGLYDTFSKKSYFYIF